MKLLFSFLVLFFNIYNIYSQEQKLEIKIKALNIGVYNKNKVKNNVLEILFGEEALKALEKRITGNQELIDYIGGYMQEQNIISYYPQEDVALFECPVRSVGVFDLKSMEDGYGDPATYTYSSSGKYRFSSLDADGVHYYLEERIDGEYVYMGLVFPFYLAQNLSGFYWEDDKTLYYSKECRTMDDSIYWRGYSVSFVF